MSFIVSNVNLRKSGLTLSPRANTPRTATRTSLLASHRQIILENPGNYVPIVPIGMARVLRQYHEQMQLMQGIDHRSKSFAKLGIVMNKHTQKELKKQFKSKKQEVENAINRHAHNLGSVLMRMTSQVNGRILAEKERQIQELIKYNPKLHKLYSAIKRAKAINNAGSFDEFYRPKNNNINAILEKNVRNLKHRKLLQMNDKTINELVKKIRTKLL